MLVRVLIWFCSSRSCFFGRILPLVSWFVCIITTNQPYFNDSLSKLSSSSDSKSSHHPLFPASHHTATISLDILFPSDNSQWCNYQICLRLFVVWLVQDSPPIEEWISPVVRPVLILDSPPVAPGPSPFLFFSTQLANLYLNY